MPPAHRFGGLRPEVVTELLSWWRGALLQDAPAGGRSRVSGLGAGRSGDEAAAHQAQDVATHSVVDADARLVDVSRHDDERPEIVTHELRRGGGGGRVGDRSGRGVPASALSGETPFADFNPRTGPLRGVSPPRPLAR